MAKFRPLIENCFIDDPAADFRAGKKVEQYRVGELALYIPAGFKWDYLPFSAVESAEKSHRSISSGKCVSVTEKKPVVDLKTATGVIKINLEKPDSMSAILDAFGSLVNET